MSLEGTAGMRCRLVSSKEMSFDGHVSSKEVSFANESGRHGWGELWTC